MSRETEAILARWRELERAVAEVEDPRLRAELEHLIEVVRGEYQRVVRIAAGEEAEDGGMPSRLEPA